MISLDKILTNNKTANKLIMHTKIGPNLMGQTLSLGFAVGMGQPFIGLAPGWGESVEPIALDSAQRSLP